MTEESVPERRQLTEEEKITSLKQLARYGQENQRLQFHIAYEDLMVTQGLQVNFETQMQKHKQELKKLHAEQETVQTCIHLLNDQLNNGVEVKQHRDLNTITDEEVMTDEEAEDFANELLKEGTPDG